MVSRISLTASSGFQVYGSRLEGFRVYHRDPYGVGGGRVGLNARKKDRIRLISGSIVPYPPPPNPPKGPYEFGAGPGFWSQVQFRVRGLGLHDSSGEVLGFCKTTLRFKLSGKGYKALRQVSDILVRMK